jgi:predicted SnoaL-like aldol condensation-catalyzing enzyme
MYTKQEEKNLKAVLDFYDVVINGQQYSRVYEFVDKNYIQHKPEVEDGPEGLLDFVRWIYSQSPQHKARIIRSFMGGDYVILHVHVINGAEAKDIAVMDIFRVENGMLMEHWDVASPVPLNAKRTITGYSKLDKHLDVRT